jgi:general secretion pathway protein L
VLHQHESAPPASVVIYDYRGGTDLAAWAGELGVDVRAGDTSVPSAVWMARSVDAQRAVDLLQGEYSQRDRMGKRFQPWYPAAALVGAWLVLAAGVDVLRLVQLSRQSDALEEAMQATFRQAFPDAKRLENAYAQMQSRMKELQRRSAQGEHSLQDMLAVTAPILARAEGLQVQSVRFRDGGLTLDLEAKDSASLAKVKQELSTQRNWQVDSQSTSRADKVESRLQIKGKGV